MTMRPKPKEGAIGSNCTFMELKLLMGCTNLTTLSSNCTFMELKLLSDARTCNLEFGSNSTFIELKLVKECILRKELKVLIVPLWN